MPQQNPWPPRPNILDPVIFPTRQPVSVLGLFSVLLTVFPPVAGLLCWMDAFFWYHRQLRPLHPFAKMLTDLYNFPVPWVGIQLGSVITGLLFIGLVCGIIARHSPWGKLGIALAVLFILEAFLPVLM